MLSHSKLGAPTSIMSDASNTAVGVVLQQFVDGVLHPISYFFANSLQLRLNIAHLIESY